VEIETLCRVSAALQTSRILQLNGINADDSAKRTKSLTTVEQKLQLSFLFIPILAKVNDTRHSVVIIVVSKMLRPVPKG